MDWQIMISCVVKHQRWILFYCLHFF